MPIDPSALALRFALLKQAVGMRSVRSDFGDVVDRFEAVMSGGSPASGTSSPQGRSSMLIDPAALALRYAVEQSRAAAYRVTETKWTWEDDGSPLLTTPLRKAGPERYQTPDGLYAVAKGPRFWYWEHTDRPEINSDESFTSKRDATDSLARYLRSTTPQKKADLYPSLGFPGGACQVIERVKDEVANPQLQESLVDQVEAGQALSNAQANKIYSLEQEKGPSGTRFKNLLITAHAQYRMDLRGVNVSDLKLFFKRFQKAWSDARSRRDPISATWEALIHWRTPIEWEDSANLTVVFVVEDRTARIVTVWWNGLRDPRPVDEASCSLPPRTAAFPEHEQETRLQSEWARLGGEVHGGGSRSALKMPAEFGYKTFVRDDSAKGLPTDLDREKQQVLPLPGSATPGGAGRDIGKFETNTPNNGIDKRPRTLPEEGENRGHPVNDNVGNFSRRTMTSAEEGQAADYPLVYQEDRAGNWAKTAEEKEAYSQQWSRGKRQRKQRGSKRLKSKNYYRKNKQNLRRKAKIYRKVNKNNGALKSSNKRRRRQVRTRRGFSLLAADFATPSVRGGPGGGRQHEQVSQDKRDDANYYRQNKSTRKQQSDREYLACKKDSRCMERRRLWREDPKRFERGRPTSREASFLTVPEIAFGIGPEMVMGYVRSVSPMTGMVTYEIKGPTHRVLESLPSEVFLRVAAFLSDEDIDAFFNLLDAEVGLEAYEDLDEDGLRECAAIQGTDLNSDDFKSKCFELTGESDLSNLSAEQMDQVNDSIVLGILEESDEALSYEDREDGDESIGDEYDPHLYYGEVEMSKAMKEASQTLFRAWPGLLP